MIIDILIAIAGLLAICFMNVTVSDVIVMLALYIILTCLFDKLLSKGKDIG